MEGTEGKQETKVEFWRFHIEKAQQFEGADNEYCRQHDLKPSTFYGYKRKFGYSPGHRKKKRNKFVQVIPPKEEFLKRQPKGLPDPKWLAEFLKAYGGLK